MGRIKEITARILFVVMFMGAMAEFNTLAMASEADVSSVFESVVNELKERDESESSGAVYFESALEEGYGEESVSEYAKSIINEHTFYSELSEEEKITVRQELGYREDTMGELCQKGYTIEESKTKALIMQQLDLSYEDMMSMVWAFGSEGKAEGEAVKFVMGLDKYTGFYTDENEKDVTELMVMGFEFEKAVNICVVKNCVADESISGAGVTVKDIAASEGAVVVSDTELSQIAEENSVNPERLNEILKSIGMSIDELYAKITEYKEKYGIIPKAMLMADDEDDVFADYIKEIENSKAPFGKEKNVLESVSETSGAVSYTDNVASIPGVNGMDFQLNLIYNSDDRIKYERNYEGNVWHFNIPIKTGRYTAEGIYVETEDGVRRTINFDLRADDVTYKWFNNYYNDVLFCIDKNATVKDSKYMLKYNDGRIIYFNREGKALREEDRFGNYINIEWSVGYATFKITNNSGMSISNAFESTEDGKVMYVYVKDENGNVLKKIKYEFETEASGVGIDSYSRIKRKTDENGKVTEYTYKPYDTYPVRNVEYREVCLTEIKYYTGLTVKYEYEDAYANEDKETYRRIDTITYTGGGEQLYKAKYTYSGNNYLYQPTNNLKNSKGDSYDYSTTKTVDGLRTERYFSKSGFKINEATYLETTNSGGIYEYKTYHYYDKDTYIYGYNPNEIEVERGQAEYRLKYDYSKTGLLINYWGPKSTENYTRRNDDELNKVSYGYGEYGLQTKKTYQKEKGVTVTEESQLTSDNKNISQTIIYTTSKTDPLSKTTYSYDSRGNVTTVGNYKNGSTPIYTYYTYDSKGINVIETKQNNIVNKAEYDVFGNITSKTDGKGHKVTYTYDIYGNQTGSSDGKYTTRTVYDYEANKVTYYDECGYMKVYDYDPVGNLAEVIDTTTTKYTYNENDMMLESAVVGGKAKLKVEYDVLNRVTKRQLVDPNNNDNVMYQEKYSYLQGTDYETETVKKGYDNEEYTDITRKDIEGNVIYTEKDGIVTESTYDLCGNMLTKTVGTGNDTAVT
ncbi:MAG: hypothetical protein Q4F63_06165, partial [Clostridia bacterium]|nr:hypothetical protein [Clostridia bacterium]